MEHGTVCPEENRMNFTLLLPAAGKIQIEIQIFKERHWSKFNCQFGPWCIVDGESYTTWEYCDIRFCERRVDVGTKGGKYPECRLSEKGIEYVGSQNTTEIGHDCLQWEEQWQYYQEVFSFGVSLHAFLRSSKSSENHCRNFQHYDRPWCFVSDPKTVWEYCEIPFCHDPNPPECKLSRHGMEYMGKLDVTMSGYPCKPWLTMIGPKLFQAQVYQYVISDELDGSHRFCRNYDENRHGPWCFSDTENGPEWEYCDVPFCSQVDGRPCEIKVAGNCVTPRECKQDEEGTTYIGTENITKKGFQCQAWISNSPNNQLTTLLDYGDLGQYSYYDR
ncbi:unnamed protein product, partial [Darwinula stevensoni]